MHLRSVLASAVQLAWPAGAPGRAVTCRPARPVCAVGEVEEGQSEFKRVVSVAAAAGAVVLRNVPALCLQAATSDPCPARILGVCLIALAAQD